MLRYSIASLLTVIMLAAVAPTAQAIGDRSPNCAPSFNAAPCYSVDYMGPRVRALPTFQAAPWYLYWPYDGHFQTPAPVHAPPTLPPSYSLPFNPYQPGFNMAYPHPWIQHQQGIFYGH
jgi:hypothetical protein